VVPFTKLLGKMKPAVHKEETLSAKHKKSSSSKKSNTEDHVNVDTKRKKGKAVITLKNEVVEFCISYMGIEGKNDLYFMTKWTMYWSPH
jgi:hypothetical protein